MPTDGGDTTLLLTIGGRAMAEGAAHILGALGKGPFVFNLGHGISQFTPPESVTAMVEAVHNFSRRQRAA